MKQLDGKKTYSMGILAILATGSMLFGLVDQEIWLAAMGLILPAQGMALRAGVAKVKL